MLKRVSAAQKSFVLKEHLIVPAVINVLANGAIAWLVMRSKPDLTLWGETGVGSDILLTSLLLPLIMGLINSRIVAGKVKIGAIEPILNCPDGHQLWMASRGNIVRNSVLAVGCLLLIGLPTLLLLPSVLGETFSVMSFVVFKGLWAGLLAAAISPAIAIWAMTAQRQPNEQSV